MAVQIDQKGDIVIICTGVINLRIHLLRSQNRLLCDDMNLNSHGKFCTIMYL